MPARILKNDLIESLPSPYRRSFTADLQRSNMEANDRLVVDTDRSVVYFPVGAVISALYTSSGATMEAYGIGREGMLGPDSPCTPEHVRFDVVCQIAGSLLSMSSSIFAQHVQQNSGLRWTIAANADGALAFRTQSAMCNALHTIAQRCARWLLITRDRVGGEEFVFTHELLARLLGVHRPSVSLALKRLQGLGIIDYYVGRIRIADKRRLEVEACECYRVVVRETDRIFRRHIRASIRNER